MSIVSGHSTVTLMKPFGYATPRTEGGSAMPVRLQGQVSPAINYTKDLIADGYVGRVLSATMIGCALNWGPTIDRTYQADCANNANLPTITGGHDRCAMLLPRRITRAYRPRREPTRPIPVEETGEIIAKTVPDQLVLSGIVGDVLSRPFRSATESTERRPSWRGSA
jgi:hypothetical protein